MATKQIRRANLLTNEVRVESPFVRVEINGYSFGVYGGKEKQYKNSTTVQWSSIKYPNYIKSLKIKKINGVVNTYTLVINYPIREGDDPNFFEKIFSSVSDTRYMKLTYGDSMLPGYVYNDESAIITSVKDNFDIKNNSIQYTVSAVSSTKLSYNSSYSFPAVKDKPSDVIKRLIKDPKYCLSQIYTGLPYRDSGQDIAGDDQVVQIDTCSNMSILDYLAFLVNNMKSVSNDENMIQDSIYEMVTRESDKGLYFEVKKVENSYVSLNNLCTYDIDIGYKSSTIVTDFKIKTEDNWSIYYDYNQSLYNDDYLKRIDNQGNITYVYSPQVLTKTGYSVKNQDSAWWTKVTQFPITGSITIKGLLRPAILMNYLKINVWFFGHKHLTSGYYLITSQEDTVDDSGYSTTLDILRVSGDEELR